MEIKRIVPVISSTIFKESKSFYTDFIRLKLAMDMDWILTFVSESNPTAQISIVRSKEIGSINSNVAISIEVSDIDEFYKRATLSKYEVTYPLTNEPWGVRRFFVKDPNGVTINLMCHLQNN